MFTDDVILVDDNTNVLKDQLECQRDVLEKNRLEIRRAKTEFLEFMFNNILETMGVVIS